MRIKSLLLSAVLLTVVFGFGISASAQTDVNALIAQLEAQIQSLLQQITTLRSQQDTTQTWCYNFNKNLGVGSTGNDVTALYTALTKEDIISEYDSPGTVRMQFNEVLASKVSEFQEKYASEILTPYKLRRGTGYVGASTRAKFNKLYGCGTPDKKTEQVKCVFQNSTSEQKCYSADSEDSRFSCSGKETCIMDVYGKKDEQIAWKSSCGGLAYTTIDGNNEYAYFNCALKCDPPVECAAPPVGCNYSGATTCACGTLVCNTQPSITVTSPNGGETYQLGSGTAILFNALNIPAGNKYTVDLVRSDKNEWTIGTGEIIPGGDGSQGIKVGFTGVIPSGSFKIRVSSTVNGIIVQDLSDNYFTINTTTTQPSITVTSPNGGETWKVGETHNITWTSSNLPTNALLSIGINGDGQTSTMAGAQIATNILASNGSYSWIIPAFLGENLAGKKYGVYATCLNCSSTVGDTSDNYFSVNSGVCTPNWQCSEWNSCSVKNQLVLDLVATVQAQLTQTTDQQKISALQAKLKQLQSYIYVSAQARTCTDSNNCGVITGEPALARACNAPSITVTSPNGGEKWTIGQTYNLSWTSTGLENAKVDLYVISSDGTVQNNIATGIANTGNYIWTIPQNQLEGAHRFYVSSGQISDHSNNIFEIWKTSQPSITVTSPNGGETWQIGVPNSVSVSFQNSGVSGNMFIYLDKYDVSGNKTNGYLLGQTALVANNAGGTIYYPNLSQDIIYSMGGAGNFFKVRIWSDASGNPQDSSDNYFSIASPTISYSPLDTIQDQLASITSTISKFLGQ